MRSIKILKLVCDNFRCFEHKEVEFGDRTIIKGRNGIGKSTIYNAVMWLLFDKDQSCNSAPNVRPHGLNDVDVSVKCMFSVNGYPIALEKVQKQKYIVDRATHDRRFNGNENLFFVNSTPKTQKEFKNYISEWFCDEETFLLCTNASSFFKLDTKKRRAKLADFVGTVSDEDVIHSDVMFESLADMLKGSTVYDLIARSKANIKKIGEEVKSIPARIDELNNLVSDVDIAELELWKNGIAEKGSSMEEFEEFLYEYSLHLRNVYVDVRNEELRKSLKDAKQKEALEMRIVDLLEDFIRKKMELLTDSVNEKFDTVKWKLFEEQVNGTLADCCKATVNGSDIENSLNDGDGLLAKLEIMRGFQRLNGLQIFMFLDRTESVNNDRIPDEDGQLIFLKVSEDKEMVIERS